jgi:hypothetical protein
VISSFIEPEGAFVTTGSNIVYTLGGGILSKSGLVMTGGNGLIAWRANGAGTTGDDSLLIPYYLKSDINVTLTTADPTNPRWDLIEMKLDFVDNDAADNVTRDFKDATTGVITSTTVVKKRKPKITVTLKTGTPAGSPTIPSVDSGYSALYALKVLAAGTSVTDDNVIDYRLPAGHRKIVQPAADDAGLNIARLIATDFVGTSIGTVQRGSTGNSPTDREQYWMAPRACGDHRRSVLREIRYDTTIATGGSGKLTLNRVNTSLNSVTLLEDLTSTLSGSFSTATPSLPWRMNGWSWDNPGADPADELRLLFKSAVASEEIRFVEWEIYGY